MECKCCAATLLVCKVKGDRGWMVDSGSQTDAQMTCFG